jgi:RND family efflux transporter MFP subunit
MQYPTHWHLAFSLLLIAGCTQPNVYQEPPPPNVKVASPITQAVTNYIEETATTEAVAKVEIRARVQGVIDSVNFEPGSSVSEGDLLYEIEPELYEARVESAEADLLTQKARIKKAELDKDREEELQKKGATSTASVVTAQAEFETAKAAVLQSEAQLKQARIDQQYTKVLAPIDGRVGKTLVKQGNLVGGGIDATLLTTIIQYDPIYANFSISERRLLELTDSVRKDEKGELDRKSIAVFLKRENDKGFPFQGHYDYADLAVDQSTGTFMIRGIFPNPDRKILPGLFVAVRLPIGVQENAVLVPERAIAEDQAGRFVYVVDSENEVERRKVSVGMRVGEMVVVQEGVTTEDTIIVDGLQRARPGAKVNPQRIELKSEVEGDQTVSPGEVSDDEAPAEAITPQD